MASGWWDDSGAISGCVAAYQAIGAASLAASYSNLQNPGTTDAVVGVAPSFASATGWSFNGSTQYLYCPLTPGSNWTFMIRTTPDYTFAGGNCALFGVATSTSQEIRLRYDNGSGIWVAYYGNLSIFGGVSPASATFSIAGTKAYRDSTQLTAALTGSLTGTIGARIGISCQINFNNTTSNFMKQTVAAFAVYNATLTAGQIATVSAAMNALTASTQSIVPHLAAQTDWWSR